MDGTVADRERLEVELGVMRYRRSGEVIGQYEYVSGKGRAHGRRSPCRGFPNGASASSRRSAPIFVPLPHLLPLDVKDQLCQFLAKRSIEADKFDRHPVELWSVGPLPFDLPPSG